MVVLMTQTLRFLIELDRIVFSTSERKKIALHTWNSLIGGLHFHILQIRNYTTKLGNQTIRLMMHLVDYKHTERGSSIFMTPESMLEKFVESWNRGRLR